MIIILLFFQWHCCTLTASTKNINTPFCIRNNRLPIEELVISVPSCWNQLFQKKGLLVDEHNPKVAIRDYLRIRKPHYLIGKTHESLDLEDLWEGKVGDWLLLKLSSTEDATVSGDNCFILFVNLSK
jgi:hypothetical protein